jgi:HlyD family secretion protein
MDIARPDQSRKRKRRRLLLGISAAAIVALITAGLSKLKPAAPTVDKASVWTDTVKRGQMLRQVRGNGTLVPEQIQFVQADTDGRVERILVLPGAEVKPETVLLELSNPELKQAAFDAEWQLKAAEAQLTKLKVQLESERLTQKAATATLKSDYEQAKLEALADENLAKRALVATLTAKRSRSKADDLGARLQIEEERLRISEDSAKAQLAVQQADLEKARALLVLKSKQVEGFKSAPGSTACSSRLATWLLTGRTTSNSQCHARQNCSTEQTEGANQDRRNAGQRHPHRPARAIDTRNGIIPGKVIRVDPPCRMEPSRWTCNSKELCREALART